MHATYVVPPTWRLGEALQRHPGLALAPRMSPGVVVAGDIRCRAKGPNDIVVDDVYKIELRVPPLFPRAVPQVFETGGRIPKSFHHLENGALCLGAPTAVRLALQRAPTIEAFLDELVLPYLYGHAYHARFDVMPFGELRHGTVGVEDHLLSFFGMPISTSVPELLRLAALSRRVANKEACPCGRGVRLGRCHSTQVATARRRLGRAWFQAQGVFLRRQKEREQGRFRIDNA